MICKAAMALIVAFVPIAASMRSAAADESLPQPQSDYLLHCGGCHGLEGTSAPAEIPVLRGRVGFFMGSEPAREYLIRLPNVAYTGIADDNRLAAMMNFVVFTLGGASVPAGAKPFTGKEVARLRAKPMIGQDLIETRAAVVTHLVRARRAPRSLLQYSAAEHSAQRRDLSPRSRHRL